MNTRHLALFALIGLFLCIRAATAAVLNVPDVYPSIQMAVDFASAYDTIALQSGVYDENVVIDKPLTLRGPNANIDPRNGVRVSEAILVPRDTNCDNGVIISVLSSHVTITGLTIDGDNPVLTGGVIVNGSDMDAGWGIRNSASPLFDPQGASVDHVTIRNTILKNFQWSAVYLANATGVSLANTIQQNTIDNVACPLPGLFGNGSLGSIYLGGNVYGHVAGNNITRVRRGVQIDTNTLGVATGSPVAITGNLIESTQVGIWLNRQSDTAIAYTVQNNTLSSAPGATENVGIDLSYFQGAASAEINNNIISGTKYGIRFWNNPTTTPLTITGGLLQANVYGVYAFNGGGGYSAAAASTLVLNGVTIRNSGTAGIYVHDEATATNPVIVTLANATEINRGAIGLLLEGARALVQFAAALPAAHFSGQTADYITLQSNGTTVPGDFNAEAATFGGKYGSQMSQPEVMAAEGKITDKVDNLALGRVRFWRTMLKVYNANSLTGKTVPLRATLSAAGGWVVTGMPLAFAVNGTPAGTSNTNSGGIAYWYYPVGEVAGVYTTDVAFAGDVFYPPVSGSGRLYVGKPVDFWIEPANATITADQTIEYYAYAREEGGGIWDLSLDTDVRWFITSDASGAFSEGDTGMIYTPEKAGTWTVQALFLTMHDEATLVVAHGAPTRLTLSPANAATTAGNKIAYTATAWDAKNNAWNVSTDVGTGWSIVEGGDGGTFTDGTNAKEYQAYKAGIWTVRATYAGYSATGNLTVDHADAVRLAIEPVETTVASGNWVVYTGYGVDFAGNKWNISLASGAVWSIDEHGDNGSFIPGTGVNAGKIIYRSAIMGTWTVHLKYLGLDGFAILYVLHGTPVHITITPATQTVTADEQATFIAMADDAAGNVWDATVEPTTLWSILEAGHGGTFFNGTGVNAGKKVYDAVKAGTWHVYATIGAVSGAAQLTVTHGAPQSIVITPAWASVASGDVVAYQARATDADGNAWDVALDPQTVWSIEPEAQGSFADGPGGKKAYTTAKAGTWTVRATLHGSEGTATLLVEHGAPVRVAITPNPWTMTSDEQVDYTATAYDAADNPWIVSSNAGTQWTITSAALGTFTKDGDVARYTPGRVGTWTVTAIYQGITGTATLTVTHGVAVSITASPATANALTGVPFTYTATAVDADGNSWDCSTDAAWDDAGANGTFAANVYTPGNPGVVTIQATLGTLTSNNCTLNVFPNPAYALTYDNNGGSPRLTLGATPVTATGWYDLAGSPTGAQLLIQVTKGTNAVTGVIQQYDPTGGTHEDAVTITTTNSLYFKWTKNVNSPGQLYALTEICTTGATTVNATFYASGPFTQIGTGSKNGAWRLVLAFTAPDTLTQHDEQFTP